MYLWALGNIVFLSCSVHELTMLVYTSQLLDIEVFEVSLLQLSKHMNL